MSKSPSLRRIQADIRELSLDPSPSYHAAPLEDDMFEWHFTIRGAEGTDFEGGTYHGRILLPPDYPFKPPHIMFLTPSGRFETNTKICLSFTAFHAELWQPAWGIRLILEALISFLPTPADGAIGSLDWSSEERKRLAKRSVDFVCPKCGQIAALLPKMDPETAAAKKKKSLAFAKEIAELQRLQQATEGGGNIKVDEEEESIDDKEGGSAGPEVPKEKEKEDDAKESLLEAPEEEVVFMTEDNVEAKTATDEEPKEIAEATTSAPGTEVMENVSQSAVEEPTDESAIPAETQINNNGDTEADAMGAPGDINDISRLYDPLLNLMLILMAIICYLLVQKYMELQEELLELQDSDYEDVHSESLLDADEL